MSGKNTEDRSVVGLSTLWGHLKFLFYGNEPRTRGLFLVTPMHRLSPDCRCDALLRLGALVEPSTEHTS